jgi:hypothetical protein
MPHLGRRLLELNSRADRCNRYKNGKVDGKVWGPWCGSALHFMEMLSVPRWEDFDICYRDSNRFQYLGRGKSRVEWIGGDLAWYLKEPGASEN